MRTKRHSLTFSQTLALAAVVACASTGLAAPYELRVYSDDIPQKEESEIELIMSAAKPTRMDEGSRGQVFQTLVEYGYGLGNGWSVGLELPISFADGRHKLNGLKVEAQYVAEHNAHQGLYWGVRGDVGYASSPYETQGSNSIDLNPILGYRWSTWHIVMNPSIEIPLSGPHAKPQFQPSAKIARQIAGTRQLGLEYFSGWGNLSSVRPPHQRDETLYLVWDEKLATSRWNFGLGQPLHPSGGSVDKWVVKVGVSLDLD